MGARADNVWLNNPGLVERLEEMVHAGDSAGQIADALTREFDPDFTRNQIMGKVKRLRLQLARAALREARLREPPPPPKPKPTPDRKVSHRFNPMIRRSPAQPSFPPPSKRLSNHPGYSFWDLPANGCKYEISEVNAAAKDFRFCGRPRYNGESYCAAHLQLSLAPSGQKLKFMSMKLPP